MNSRSILLALITAIFSLTASASSKHAANHGQDELSVGQPGKATEVKRTVQVQMGDSMRFIPASFSVKQGDTLRFVVKNTGKLKHEFVLGTKKDLEMHAQAMKKFLDMAHTDEKMLSVEPGQTGELVWKFTKAGMVHVACLHPGHYEAGMKAEIQVLAN